MDEQAINKRLDALENKIDILLDYVNSQRLSTQSLNDLTGDLAIIGKDFYDTAVEELDKRQVQINPEEVTELLIAFLRNIKNFREMINIVEMVSDLMKELGPIFNETIIDVTKKMAEFEAKGYFEFVKNVGPIIDKVVTGLTPQELKDLADNIMLIIHTIKDLTQPEMLKSIDNAIHVYSSIEIRDVQPYSVWRVMKEINTPEMKKALGFGVTFMKNLSKNMN
ncbi:MAG: DUF1641 domain-containing protein [Deltaproteobacteria bacterium]